LAKDLYRGGTSQLGLDIAVERGNALEATPDRIGSEIYSREEPDT